MTTMSRADFAAALGAVAVATGKPLDEATLETYWQVFQKVDAGLFGAACRRAVNECRWFPRVVELRELCGEMSPEDRAIRSWRAVDWALSLVGPYCSVDFDDPITNATVRHLGGWPNVCPEGTTVREWESFIRKRFVETYASLYRSGVSAADCGRLPGIHESGWAAGGNQKMIAENPATVIGCKLPAVRPELIKGELPRAARLEHEPELTRGIGLIPADSEGSGT